MALYKGGESMDDALMGTYGLDRVALENRWRASVGASPLSAAYSNDVRPTPVPAPTILLYTLNPNVEGQFVGSSGAQRASVPTTETGAVTREHVSNTPAPLVYSAHSSDTGEGVRDTPVPLVYGVPSSSGDERAPEGRGRERVRGFGRRRVGPVGRGGAFGSGGVGCGESPQRTRRARRVGGSDLT